jgi:hypothetical protein
MDDDTLFAFTAAGCFSLSGTHYCRKALWDSTVSDESEFKGRGRYKQLIVLRALVWLSYGSATIDFFIIAPLSNYLKRTNGTDDGTTAGYRRP